jgi:hypothetical protein
MLRFVLIAAVAGVSACSSPEGEVEQPAGVAVAQPPGREAIYTAARVGPEAFVRAVYEAHAARAMGEPPAPGQDPIYGRMLNAMMGEDVRRSTGGKPTLDWDPICGCEERAGAELQSITVRELGPREAEADVVFKLGDASHRQTLMLLKEGPLWRITDVRRPEQPPLSETLLAAID